jgi:hypothetical protein
LNAILIVFLSVLAIVQVRGLILKPGAASAPESAAPIQYTVERTPEILPEPPPPRTSGRSVIKVTRVHLADATN